MLKAAPPTPSAGPPAAAVAAAPAGRSAEQVKALYDPASYEEVTLDGMRRTIAARLLQAKQTIPHFYVTADVEIDRLKALREEVNAAAPKDRDGNPLFKLSLNDFVVRALALALQRVPRRKCGAGRVTVSCASSVPTSASPSRSRAGSCTTPVVRSADTKSVSAISAEMKDLAARARAKKLKPHEYQGGSAAVSNLGMYGVREFAAIINPPHATILAVGAARRQAVEKVDGGVAFASMLTVTLSCDHRVVDGAVDGVVGGIQELCRTAGDRVSLGRWNPGRVVRMRRGPKEQQTTATYSSNTWQTTNVKYF